MVYLFGSPMCPTPQSLSVSCAKFSRSWVHTNLAYMRTGERLEKMQGFSLQHKHTNLKKSTKQNHQKKQINKASIPFVRDS